MSFSIDNYNISVIVVEITKYLLIFDVVFQTFFAEITYQKSIMESKNKVHQKVGTTKPKLTNIDFSPVDDPMEELNQRFQVSIKMCYGWLSSTSVLLHFLIGNKFF